MQTKNTSYKDRRRYIQEELKSLFQYLEGHEHVVEEWTFYSDKEYTIGERLGFGGFGTVYRYHHNMLDMDFALKVFDPVFVSNEENLEGEKRFYREAKMLFRLKSDYIVQIYDIGRVNGKLAIRMEIIEGGTIQEWVDKIGPVPFKRSTKPIIAILNGLNQAHKMGIIHRDLKPKNIMATAKGKFKIIDFGISAFIEKEEHTKLTLSGESIAGGQFTDPALIDNPKLRDIRSDIYSVGAIWYYILTGRSPSGADISKKLLESENVTQAEAEVVLKCLSSVPEDRYQSSEELLSIINPRSDVSNANNVISLDNRITEVTRQDIIEYLTERYSEEINNFIYSQNGAYQEPERVFRYNGKKNVVDFLSRLYDLENIHSVERRFRSFAEEIYQHSVRSEDWHYNWVFYDKRLGLEENDELLLKFLCEMFHPVVRSSKTSWEEVMSYINELLIIDGYEIYESGSISGRSVFSYKYYLK